MSFREIMTSQPSLDAGVEIIPIAHHNLLDESEICDECTIDNTVNSLWIFLETWDVPLFLSGHRM